MALSIIVPTNTSQLPPRNQTTHQIISRVIFSPMSASQCDGSAQAEVISAQAKVTRLGELIDMILNFTVMGYIPKNPLFVSNIPTSFFSCVLVAEEYNIDGLEHGSII